MHPLPKLGWTMIFSPKSPEVQLPTIKLKALWNEGTTFIGVASGRRLWVCKCPICWQVSGSGHFFSISHCWPMKPSWHLHVPVRPVVVVVLVLGCKHCILALKSNLASKYNFLHHQHIHRCHRGFNDLGPGMGQSPCPLQHIAAEQSTPPHPKKQMHWPRGNQQRHWGVHRDGSDTNIQKLDHLLPINYSMTRFLGFPILVAWKCPASVKVPFYILLYPVVMWYISGTSQSRAECLFWHLFDLSHSNIPNSLGSQICIETEAHTVSNTEKSWTHLHWKHQNHLLPLTHPSTWGLCWVCNVIGNLLSHLTGPHPSLLAVSHRKQRWKTQSLPPVHAPFPLQPLGQWFSQARPV